MTAQDQLMAQYGYPNIAYQEKYCSIWEVQNDFPWFSNVINSGTGLPTNKIFINNDFKAKLMVALKAIETGGFQGELTRFDGCYMMRKSRTTNLLSLHAWAVAVDLDAFDEKLGQSVTNWSEGFLDCMRNAGLFCGCDFRGTKDPMHFALLDG